jgi:hypothetical protein
MTHLVGNRFLKELMMQASRNAVIYPDSEIRLCVFRAAVNWMEWIDCFEHQGSKADNPVLRDENRFWKFTQEYKLRWLGSREERNDFRKRINRSSWVKAAIERNDSTMIDRCVAGVRATNGKQQMSAISKIATFLDPAHFMPIDKFSKKGLRRLGAMPREYCQYSSFMTAIQKYAEPKLKDQILHEIERTGLDRLIANKDGFYLRVLDVALMSIGGRWSGK